jgi:uncharacterized RDD family membrane protein YckC
MNQLGESVCASCGQRFSTSDMVAYGNSWICAGCKPGFFQRLQQGENLSTHVVYGGFWLRFVAKCIDGIIMYLLQLPLLMLLGIPLTGVAPKDPAQLASYLMRLGISTTVSIVITVAFTVFFLGRFGATPGKMALNLKVVRPGGEPVTYLQALGRYFSEMVSSMTCGIGYVIAGFDIEKRALHDRIASTRVIKVSR